MRKLQVDAKDILMHIDRTHQVTMSGEPAGAARPISAFGLVFVPTSGTPARGASFRASEARDVSSFGFVGEIVDILAIFPASHALIVVASALSITHAVRVANEESAYLVLDAEIDHDSGCFMAHIPDTPFGTAADLVLGSLQLLPTAGVLLAAALLFGKLPQLPTALPLERANTAPGHDQGCTRVGSDGGQVDLSQVNGGLPRSRSMFCLGDLDADVQLKAPVPHQRTRPAALRKVERQDERGATPTHRQEDPPLLRDHGLSRPVDRVEAFGAPGVLHAHLWMLSAQFAGGLDSAEEGAEDGLHRLAMQGKAPFGQAVQVVLSGPRCMQEPGGFMGLHAQVPYLRLLQAPEERRRKMRESIDAYRVHTLVFFFSAPKAVGCWMGEKTQAVLPAGSGTFIPSPQGRRVFPCRFDNTACRARYCG
jgi:hypothetical protein